MSRSQTEERHNELAAAVAAAHDGVRAAGDAVARAIDAIALTRTLEQSLGLLPEEVGRQDHRARTDALRTVSAAVALTAAIEDVLDDATVERTSPIDALGALYLRFESVANEHEEERQRMLDEHQRVDDGGCTPDMHASLAVAWRSAARIAQESFERVKGATR